MTGLLAKNKKHNKKIKLFVKFNSSWMCMPDPISKIDHNVCLGKKNTKLHMTIYISKHIFIVTRINIAATLYIFCLFVFISPFPFSGFCSCFSSCCQLLSTKNWFAFIHFSGSFFSRDRCISVFAYGSIFVFFFFIIHSFLLFCSFHLQNMSFFFLLYSTIYMSPLLFSTFVPFPIFFFFRFSSFFDKWLDRSSVVFVLNSFPCTIPFTYQTCKHQEENHTLNWWTDVLFETGNAYKMIKMVRTEYMYFVDLLCIRMSLFETLDKLVAPRSTLHAPRSMQIDNRRWSHTNTHTECKMPRYPQILHKKRL